MPESKIVPSDVTPNGGKTSPKKASVGFASRDSSGNIVLPPEGRRGSKEMIMEVGKRVSTSLMQFTYGTLTDNMLEEDVAASKEMNAFTLSFRRQNKELDFCSHRERVEALNHFSYGFKLGMCLLLIIFIAVYDIMGSAGSLDDSKEMDNYYKDRLKWHAGFAAVWIALFLGSIKLPMDQPKLWRNVCRVGGALVFIFKEGCNMATYTDRYKQLNAAQDTCPWTEDAHEMASTYLMDSYYTNSITGSLFILLLIQAVLKFDWLGNLLSTSVMVVLTVVLAVMLEREVDRGEVSVARTTLFSLFTIVAGGLFGMYSYNEERRKRIEWFKAQLHMTEMNKARRKSEATRSIKNVKSEMDMVIQTLVNMDKKKNDVQLKRVIAMLRGGDNLWEASVADMNLMPTWLQEQNRAYMVKKENEAFSKKHKDATAKAYEIRGDSEWNDGERIKVTKTGRFTNAEGMIIESDWNGRIQVKMDRDGCTKSYLANEIVKIGRSSGRRQTVSLFFSSQQGLMDRVDEWDFDVLEMQKQLHALSGGSGGSSEASMNDRISSRERSYTKELNVFSVLGMHLFERHKAAALGIDMKKMLTYLNRIEKMYNPNPYHNAMHGVDCMRSIHYFYIASDLAQLLTHEEIFAGLLAGAVHDVQHPGVNTQYLCNTSDPLAITYNDISPLENMHCATAFAAAEETKVLQTLPGATQRIIRKQVVSMILATDLAQHFSTLAKFKAKLTKYTGVVEEQYAAQLEALSAGSDGGGGGEAEVAKRTLLQAMMESGETEDRMDVFCLCIKSGDIGHAAKPWRLHEQWSKRVLQEFFNQGDIERRREMPISSLCDRQDTDVWKGQIGFLDFLAMPQAKVWCDCLASEAVSQSVLGTMRTNKEEWQALREKEADQTAFINKEQLDASFFEMEAGWDAIGPAGKDFVAGNTTYEQLARSQGSGSIRGEELGKLLPMANATQPRSKKVEPLE